MTTRDVHSLLRWAPRSRAVIVCGELAGIGVHTIERILRAHAPDVPVIAGEELSFKSDRARDTVTKPDDAIESLRRRALRPIPLVALA